MGEFQERQVQAEQTVSVLKEQLEILKQLAVKKKKDLEQAEIERLQKANATLQEDIKKIRSDLRFFEAQNGVKSIPLPATQKVTQTQAASSASAETTTSTETVPPVNKEAPVEKKKEKKKKEAKPQKPKAGGADDDKPVDVSRLLMKVGKIVEVNKHPDADSLYVEKVDLGEGTNRTIVSGLVKHVTLEQMQNRMAVFMCNLKPAKMRGVLSQGMIMCASTPEKVEILEVPSTAAIGDVVTCVGYPGEADAQLNPKKKIWEQVQPDLRVDSNGIPGYKGGNFTIVGKDGNFSAPTMKDCPIK